jgi:hypothetical protein
MGAGWGQGTRLSRLRLDIRAPLKKRGYVILIRQPAEKDLVLIKK